MAPLYPATPAFGYVSALIGSAQRRLDAVGAPASRLEPPLKPADWPQRAGFAALAEAARLDGDAAAAEPARQALRGALAGTPPRLAGLRPWTDDMFMATLLVDRTLPLLPAAEQAAVADALQAALLDLCERLQRADGLFDHAVGSPIAWGRGNGFAALALAQALAGPLRGRPGPLRDRLRRHLRALLPLQAGNGLWRQVLDHEPAAPELTVTAMSLAALALARRQGWVDGAEIDAAIERAWAGVQGRVDADGGFRDVCAGTPAGRTLDFYLQRPMLQGRDDRAAAMVLQAALALGAASD